MWHVCVYIYLHWMDLTSTHTHTKTDRESSSGKQNSFLQTKTPELTDTAASDDWGTERSFYFIMIFGFVESRRHALHMRKEGFETWNVYLICARFTEVLFLKCAD